MRPNHSLKVILMLMVISLLACGCTQNTENEFSSSEYYTEAEKLVLMASFEEAIENYSAALKALSETEDDNALNISEGLIYFNIGYCYEQLEDREEALQAYMLSKNDPRSEVLSLTALGKLYFDSKQYEQSKAFLSEAIEKDDSAYEAYVNLSAIFSIEEDYDMALSLLSKAIEVDRKRSEAYVNRGYLFAKLGKETLMKEDIERLKALNEPNLDVYLKIYNDTLREEGH